jgi:hypothetical protein
MSAVSLIKRSMWLGIKISLLVMIPVCILAWLSLIGLILYKSLSLRASPLEIVMEVDSRANASGSPVFISRTADAFGAVGLLGVAGVAFSAITAAAIGAIAIVVQKLRS